MKSCNHSAVLAAISVILAGSTVLARADKLISNRDPDLAIQALSGAQVGSRLGLRNDCSQNCAWNYRAGIIYVDGGLTLAIKAVNLRDGGELVLAVGCGSNQPECVWRERDGMFVSAADPSLAISAWGGARNGATLKLSSDCRPNNPDCTWSVR